MRLLRLGIVIALIAAVTWLVVPGHLGRLTSGSGSILSRILGAAQVDPGQRTYDQLCPVYDAFLATSGPARQQVAAAVSAVAAQAQGGADAAAKALLSVVPAALGDPASPATGNARALVARECKAHDQALRNG